MGLGPQGFNQEIKVNRNMAICEFCGKREGTEVIQDERGRPHRICLICDSEMEWQLDMPVALIERTSDSYSITERGWKNMESNEIQAKVNQYAELFNSAKRLVKDDAVAIAIVQEIGKHLRVAEMATERGRRVNGQIASDNGSRSTHDSDDEPTQKQLDFLRDLGVSAKPRTRVEASAMLDQALNGR